MDAREFFTNTFNTEYLLPDELETIITAMELYANGKCKEQRELCYEAWLNMPQWNDDSVKEFTERAHEFIVDSPVYQIKGSITTT